MLTRQMHLLNLKRFQDWRTGRDQRVLDETELTTGLITAAIDFAIKELEMAVVKPSWKDAPSWANYLARDADGEWYWHENEPKIDSHMWIDNKGNSEFCGVDKDWRESLQSRPE
jgi:hypothetical protein